ncbi:hypothetical protein AAFC00_006089 [Neodothiora populina]|uniref:Phenylacetaldoxime dehydratase n=1 Tax=Neodothiora populina TaxID=2781224 RepID=A0ABR3P887_9PEZI
MVFLIDLGDEDLLFTYAIFGVQHPTMSAEKKRQISTLHDLLSSSAGRVDQLCDEDHGTKGGHMPPSTTFVAYWLRSSDYEEFAQSKAFADFWNDLPDDAGVWREVMTVPKARYMFAASQEVKWGLATMSELKISNDEGYWGVYRHRLGDVGDTYTSPYVTNTMNSTTSPETAAENVETARPVLSIPQPGSPSIEGEQPIRRGKVTITNPPDNLCFVREGQRQPHVSKEEVDLWIEHISPHAASWIDHLDTNRQKNGVMTFTTHVGRDRVASSDTVVEAAPVAETNQLAFFLDLAHFERAGRSHKGHVQLRKNVMQHYGPGGQMQKLGKAELFVELCVLKSGDLIAEYIGCTEGTGLMWLESDTKN